MSHTDVVTSGYSRTIRLVQALEILAGACVFVLSPAFFR